jgi:enterobacterial common antigen flippase
VAHDNADSTQLMNAQIEIGLLLAAPGILLVLALGPTVLQILYSAQFTPAFEILRWQSLGTFLRVISWPLAYLMLAKGDKALFFWTELATNVFYLFALIVGLEYMGMPGIGVAFMLMYLFHAALTLLVARRLSKFEWTTNNLTKLGIIIPLVFLAFLCSYLPVLWAATVGIFLSVGVGIYSLKALYTLIGRETVLAYYQRFRARLRL